MKNILIYKLTYPNKFCFFSFVHFIARSCDRMRSKLDDSHSNPCLRFAVLRYSSSNFCYFYGPLLFLKAVNKHPHKHSFIHPV